MPAESFGKIVKRRTMGVALICVVAGLISLSIAIYNKAFTSTVDVKLRTDYTGNQLQPESDVKVRGLIVGSVESVHSNGSYATVNLHLDPSKVDLIPSNVTAQILPKTLFGEQYVSLTIPSDPSTQHLKQGSVIAQDRSQGALEAQTVLSDLYPLLTAVQPAQLDATLTALATALHGRGTELGQTLVNFDKYLKILNGPSGVDNNTYTSQIVNDLDKLGKVATEYNTIAPDLFGSLENLLTSARTIVAKQQALDSLLTDGTSTSQTLETFLADNKDRIIAVSGQTSKVFSLLNTYSPEFTCLFAGINKLYIEGNDAIYDGAIHLGAEVDLTKSAPGTKYGGYKDGEQPKTVTGYGPNCFGLPDNVPTDAQGYFQIPSKYVCLNDGAWLTVKGATGGCSSSASSSSATSTSSTSSGPIVGSPAEDAMVNSLIAGQLGTTPDHVSGTATLLAGPLLRGQKVQVGS